MKGGGDLGGKLGYDGIVCGMCEGVRSVRRELGGLWILEGRGVR